MSPTGSSGTAGGNVMWSPCQFVSESLLNRTIARNPKSKVTRPAQRRLGPSEGSKICFRSQLTTGRAITLQLTPEQEACRGRGFGSQAKRAGAVNPQPEGDRCYTGRVSRKAVLDDQRSPACRCPLRRLLAEAPESPAPSRCDRRGHYGSRQGRDGGRRRHPPQSSSGAVRGRHRCTRRGDLSTPRRSGPDERQCQARGGVPVEAKPAAQ